MMNGYAKTRQVRVRRSSLDDLSTLFSPLQPPRHTPNNESKNRGMTQNQNVRKAVATHVSFPGQEGDDEDGAGEIFGEILRIKSSVSCASSDMLQAKKQKKNSALGSTVKRTLSMRRSHPVAVGYCRIQHECDPLAEDEGNSIQAGRSERKRGKILKACRRLFGF